MTFAWRRNRSPGRAAKTWWRPPGWSVPRWRSLECFLPWSTSSCSSAWHTFSRSLASRGDRKSMGMQWYIIHTYSGFEKKVKESLESRVAAFSLQDKIGRVLIPTEEVVEVRGGKKVVSSRMSYPGSVLVEMDLDENTWHTVRSTPRVTGFVGSATSPSPLSDAEVDGIINRVHTPQDRPKPKVVFERNEPVRSVDGPFANFNGSVEEIDRDISRLKVSGTIFGRSTPAEMDFASVEKLG